MIDLLTVGEAMATVRACGPLRLGGNATVSMAGAEVNVAIGVSRLGHSARWVGVVGDDELGALVLRTLRAEGVFTEHVRVDDARPTGVLIRERRLGHTSRVTYFRAHSAGSLVNAADVEGAGDQPPRWIHVTGITPALSDCAGEAVATAIDVAARTGARLCLDVNYRNGLWTRQQAATTLRPLAAHAAVIVASDDELELVAPDDRASESDQIAALIELGVDEVVIKRGADGATLHTARGNLGVSAHCVPVVDTVGAGDAFTAGYLSAALDDLPPADRLARGVACGAFAVAGEGDWEGLPTRADLALLDLKAGSAQR